MTDDKPTEQDADLRDGDEVARDAEDGPTEELVEVTGDDRPPERYAGLAGGPTPRRRPEPEG